MEIFFLIFSNIAETCFGPSLGMFRRMVLDEECFCPTVFVWMIEIVVFV